MLKIFRAKYSSPQPISSQCNSVYLSIYASLRFSVIIGERLSCETKIVMEISRDCGLSASMKMMLSQCPGKAIERIESILFSPGLGYTC